MIVIDKRVRKYYDINSDFVVAKIKENEGRREQIVERGKES